MEVYGGGFVVTSMKLDLMIALRFDVNGCRHMGSDTENPNSGP